MPVAPDRTAHVLLINGPLAGSRTVILDGDKLTDGTEFEVAWDGGDRTARYVVSRGFEIECFEHKAIHLKVIAVHKPRVPA